MNTKINDQTFYMVWCEDTAGCRYRHADLRDAVEEAKRLATANPGKRFYVLMALRYAFKEPETALVFELDEIPF